MIEHGLAAQPEARQPSADTFVTELLSAIGVSKPDVRAEFIRNPFKGLAAFDELDSADFFGRSEEIEQLHDLISVERFVMVVGPSGSGKSSLVRAGLIPSLRTGTLLGPREPLIVTSVPGAYPFDELATALSGVSTKPLADLVTELRSDSHGLLRICKQLSADHDSEVVVFIDQFEELYTLVLDETARHAFVESLIHAATDPRSRVQIVATIRADFFDRPLGDDRLGSIVSGAHLALPAPSAQQLIEAIEQPAAHSGVHLEAGLSEAIVTDISGEPGSLPLLQFLMTDLVDRSDDGSVTWQSYQDAGRVAGALARRAEDVYESLTEPDRGIAREMFLRLVTVSEELDDVRRRVRQTELEALGLEISGVERVLDRFGAARLLTFDRDPLTRGTTVEVAHEALLREWPRFQGWVDDRRGSLIGKRRFDLAFDEWLVGSKSPDLLPSGVRLSQFEEWATAPGMALTEEERSFLGSAVRQNEDQQRRRVRRRRSIVAALSAAAVISLGLASYAWIQASVSTAREIIAEAETNLELDPELSILLAVESAQRFDRFGDVPPRVTDVLRTAMAANRVVARIDDAVSVGASDDGSVILTVAGDGTADLWDPATFSHITDLSTDAGHIFAVLPSTTAAEMFLGVHGASGYDVYSWTVGATEIGDRVSVETQTDLDSWWVAVSPDGRYTAASSDSQIFVRERATGTITYTGDFPAAEFSFADNGRLGYLEAGPAGTSLMIVEPASGQVIQEIASDEIPTESLFVSFAPDGRRVAVASQSEVALFDLTTEEMVWRRDDLGRVFRPRWFSTGEVLVGGEGILAVIEGDTGEIRHRLPGHQGGTWYYTPIEGTSLVASTGLEDDQLLFHEIGIDPSFVPSFDIPIQFPLTNIVVDFEGRAFLHDPVSAAFIDPDDPESSRYEPGGPIEPALQTWAFPIASDNGAFFAYTQEGRSRMWSLEQARMVYEAPAGTSIRGIDDQGTEVVLADDDTVTWVPIGEPNSAVAIAAGQLGANVLFTPDFLITISQHIESSEPWSSVNLWERDTMEHVLGFGKGETASWMVVLSPDGSRIATSGGDGTIYVYDLPAMIAGASETDALVRTIDAHNAFIVAIDISADSSMIASTSWGEPARVWHIETGDRIGTFGSRAPAIGFHLDEPRLYVAESGRLTVHTLDPGELIEQAKETVTRGLSQAECERYLRRTCEN